MKTIFAAGLLMALLAGFQPLEQPQTSAGVISGTWRARLSDSWTRRDRQGWGSLELERDADRHYGTSGRQSELEAAGIRGDSFTGSGVHFALQRDAGRLDFEGAFDAGRGAGTFRFTPDGAFVSALQKGGRAVSADDALRLALHDVDRAFI